VATPESCDAQKIQAIANGADPNKVVCGFATPAAPSTSTMTPAEKAWAAQLDYLKRNTVRLQPEARKIASPPTQPPVPNQTVCSTFPNGRCPTPEEAAAARAQQEAEAADAERQRIAAEAKEKELKRKLFGPMTPEEKAAADAKAAAEEQRRVKAIGNENI